jgi:hypothetical protein
MTAMAAQHGRLAQSSQTQAQLATGRTIESNLHVCLSKGTIPNAIFSFNFRDSRQRAKGREGRAGHPPENRPQFVHACMAPLGATDETMRGSS